MAPGVRPDGTAQPGQKDEGRFGTAPVKVAFEKAQTRRRRTARARSDHLAATCC